MSGRIVLFGATGYTGELAAGEMVDRGLEPLLAARNAGKLERLSAEMGGLETAVADVGRPKSVRDLLEKGDVLVSTVGPFSRWGGPALDAAIGAGAHYIDSTGEPVFIRRVFETEGPRAEAAGCGLLTALGYDWVPGNLAGALALRDGGEGATGVRIGYFISGDVSASGMSGGTRASSVGAFMEPQFGFRAGRIETERGAARVERFDVGGRERPAISVSSSGVWSRARPAAPAPRSGQGVARRSSPKRSTGAATSSQQPASRGSTDTPSPGRSSPGRRSGRQRGS